MDNVKFINGASDALLVPSYVFRNIQTPPRRLARLVSNFAWCSDHANECQRTVALPKFHLTGSQSSIVTFREEIIRLFTHPPFYLYDSTKHNQLVFVVLYSL